MRKTLFMLYGVATLMCSLTLSSVNGAENNRSVLDSRHGLIESVRNQGLAAVPELIAALDHESELVRITAAHLLLHLGEGADAGFRAALDSDDDEVRRMIVLGLADLGLLEAYWPRVLLDHAQIIRLYVRHRLLDEFPLPEGERMDQLMDELAGIYAEAEPERRIHVVELFAAFDEIQPQARRILIKATEDEDVNIRQRAYEGLLRHMNREWDKAAELLEKALADPSESIREMGLELRWKLLEVEQVRMPREGWRFRTDPEAVGRAEGWYAPGFDDREWQNDVPIETSWQDYMDAHYHGVAWYRITLDVPELPAWDRAYLHFEGIDEQAWVWLNGEFVGAHTMGPAGWDVPLLLEADDFIIPGAENQLTVKVQNSRGGGGIWRPLRLRILDTTILGL